MIHVLPTTDSKPHTGESKCPCNPKFKIEDGEMMLVHNAFTDNRQEWTAIDQEFDFVEDLSDLN